MVRMVQFKIPDKPSEVNLLTLSGLNYNNNDILLPVCYTYTEENNSNENQQYEALPAKELFLWRPKLMAAAREKPRCVLLTYGTARQ